MFNKIASAFGFLDTVAPPPPPPSTEYNWDDPTSGAQQPQAAGTPAGGFAVKKVLTESEIEAIKKREEEERIERELAITRKKAGEELRGAKRRVENTFILFVIRLR